MQGVRSIKSHICNNNYCPLRHHVSFLVVNVDYQPRVLGSPMVFLKGTTVRCSYLTLLDDDILEGPETFLIALSSEDEDVHVTTANATVVILDNDGIL